MAGSYRHCVGENGHFDFQLIENMGDAYEACREMFYLINSLVEDLAEEKPESQIQILKDAEKWLTQKDKGHPLDMIPSPIAQEESE